MVVALKKNGNKTLMVTSLRELSIVKSILRKFLLQSNLVMNTRYQFFAPKI